MNEHHKLDTVGTDQCKVTTETVTPMNASQSLNDILDDVSSQVTGLSKEECRRRREVGWQKRRDEMASLAVGPKWKVQVHGKAGESSFEISVIDSHNVDYTQTHYGWFDDKKLLISHNGGPCHWPLTQQVWDKIIRIAHEVADELNTKEHP